MYRINHVANGIYDELRFVNVDFVFAFFGNKRL